MKKVIKKRGNLLYAVKLRNDLEAPRYYVGFEPIGRHDFTEEHSIYSGREIHATDAEKEEFLARVVGLASNVSQGSPQLEEICRWVEDHATVKLSVKRFCMKRRYIAEEEDYLYVFGFGVGEVPSPKPLSLDDVKTVWEIVHDTEVKEDVHEGSKVAFIKTLESECMRELDQGYWLDHDEEMRKYIDAWVGKNCSEAWRVIPGYSGYVVNKKGEIKNASTGRQVTAHMEKRRMRVKLRNDTHVLQGVYVDVAVALAYVPCVEGENCRFVHHKNMNLLDNRPENLYWSKNIRPYIRPNMVGGTCQQSTAQKDAPMDRSFHEIKCPNCKRRMDWRYMYETGLHCRCGVETRVLAKELDANPNYTFYTYFIKERGQVVYVGVTETSLVRRLSEHCNHTLGLEGGLTNKNLSSGGFTVHVSVILGECELMDILRPKWNSSRYNQKRYSEGIRLFRNRRLVHYVAVKDGKYHQDLHGMNGKTFDIPDYVGKVEKSNHKKEDIRRQFCHNPLFKGVHYRYTYCMCERPCKVDYYIHKKKGESELKRWKEEKHEEGEGMLKRYGKLMVNKELQQAPFVLYAENNACLLRRMGCFV